jgi:hypothetical protein
LEDTDTFSDNAPILSSPDNLIISHQYPSGSILGKLPALAIYKDEDAQDIIDGDLDAWIAQRFAMANRIYNLTDLLPDGMISNWPGVVNVQLNQEGPYWRLSSTDVNYSLHTWDAFNIPVVAGEEYIMRWWAKLGAYDVANFATFDVTNGVFIQNVLSYAGSLNHNSMTMVEAQVVAPAGCSEIAISPFRGGDGPAEIIIAPIVEFFQKNA